MPTSLVDHTRERKGEVWGGFGIGCILKNAYSGTVCFPAGAEFGCGDDKEVGVEKEESLELKIGAEKEGFGADLTIGTKTTKSEKWTIKSKECQWCKPEICFPDSKVEVWTCSTVLSLYYHDYDKTYFYPGPVVLDVNNCGPDVGGHCGCKEVVLTQAGPARQMNGRGSSPARSALVLKPLSFVRTDQQSASDPEALSKFAKIYEQDVTAPKFSGERYAIGILEPGELVNWVCPTNGSLVLSLLSRSAADLPSGAIRS